MNGSDGLQSIIFLHNEETLPDQLVVGACFVTVVKSSKIKAKIEQQQQQQFHLKWYMKNEALLIYP